MHATKKAPRIALSATFPLFFQEGDTTQALLRRGIYNHVDVETFNDRLNPVGPLTVRDGAVEAICFDEVLGTSEILEAMKVLRKNPAGLLHHLGVSAIHPHFMRQLAREYGVVFEKTSLLVVSLNPIPTCVADTFVYPTYVGNGAFGSGMNLVGYQDNGRVWPENAFFLVTQ